MLPFRFISAARAVPQLEPILEPLMLKAVASQAALAGPTAVLVDESGSMEAWVSQKSQVTRQDAACAVAMLVRERCARTRVFVFSTDCREVEPRRGFALRDAIRKYRNPAATYLGKAVKHVYRAFPECQRLIVVTDEQSADRPPQPQGRGYIINVGGYQNGIGYGPWVTIDGWSEHSLEYIREAETVG